MTSDSSALLPGTTSLINNTLDQFFENAIHKAAKISPHYMVLWQELQRLIRSGGKRVRPTLTLLAYDAYGGTDITAALPIAAAQELLHVGMLIHDDIIDHDYVRHGVPNIEGSYRLMYRDLIKNAQKRDHAAQSSALLGGDLLMILSHDLIEQSTFSAEKRLVAGQQITQSIFRVAGGQLLDIESSIRAPGTIDARTIARYKTASYTFIGPLVTGAQLAGASTHEISLLRQFGENLGIAYQFKDDCLGIFGNEAQTGKSISSDIREGKRTFLIEQFYMHASTDDIYQFERYFGEQTSTDTQVNSIKELLISSGALEKTELEIATYVKAAQSILDKLTIPSSTRARFSEFVSLAAKREK